LTTPKLYSTIRKKNLQKVSYKEIFPLIKENKIWLGPSITSGGRNFEIPKNIVDQDRFTGKILDGRYYQNIMGVRWFTNLDHKKRHEELVLYKKYTPEEYPKYDNYDAIEVSKTVEIPIDYDGIMGVPISFLDKYNPEQFEILGIDRYIEGNQIPNKRFMINEKEIYARLVIRKR
jgi:hypothetical protein